MIVCTKCGMHNADGDTFCGQCGAFLEWEGERVAPDPAPAAPAPASGPRPVPVPAEEHKTGVVGRVKAAIGMDAKSETDTQTGPAAWTPTGRPPAPTPPPAPVSGPAITPPPAPAPSSGHAPAGEPAAVAASDQVPAPPPAGASSHAAEPVAPATTSPADPSTPGSEAVTAPPGPDTAVADAGPAAIVEAPATQPDAGAEMSRRAEALLARPMAPQPAPRPPTAGQRPAAPAAASPAARQPAAQPDAVRPGKPIDRPAPRQAPVAPTQAKFRPGDLICGQCGQGNDPKRNFCHRCGVSLKEAVVVTVPWWRRLFRRRPKKPVGAGERPSGGRTTGNRRQGPNLGRFAKRLLVVAVIVGALVAVALPGVRRSVTNSATAVIGKVIYHYVPITISKAEAPGNEVAGHAASNVFQGEPNSFWAAPVLKAGVKPRIRLFFDRPYDVALLSITGGDPANFPGNPRPRTILYQFSDAKTHKALPIDNIDTPQKFKVSAKKVTYVDIAVEDVYPVAGSSFYSAVSRIEVFQKKAGK